MPLRAIFSLWGSTLNPCSIEPSMARNGRGDRLPLRPSHLEGSGVSGIEFEWQKQQFPLLTPGIKDNTGWQVSVE